MLLPEEMTNISKRKAVLSCRCYDLQNVKTLEPLSPRVSKARNTAHGDWRQPPEGDGALKWMEWMEDKIRGWGRFQGEKGLHCPSPTWGLSEESRGIVWMQEYPPSAQAKMVMNGPDLGDAVSCAEGFHTNEDASAERSEIICSKSPSRRGRGRSGTLAVRFPGHMLLARYFILHLLWLYRITGSSRFYRVWRFSWAALVHIHSQSLFQKPGSTFKARHKCYFFPC